MKRHFRNVDVFLRGRVTFDADSVVTVAVENGIPVDKVGDIARHFDILGEIGGFGRAADAVLTEEVRIADVKGKNGDANYRVSKVRGGGLNLEWIGAGERERKRKPNRKNGVKVS